VPLGDELPCQVVHVFLDATQGWKVVLAEQGYFHERIRRWRGLSCADRRQTPGVSRW
jgi:hypothetical protein